MNKEIINKNTIALMLAGSHAYGTNREGSDIDYRGVAIIKDPKFYMGFNSHFEQYADNDPDDLVIYDIRKSFRLMADCNPNMLELLFTDRKFYKNITPYWEMILEHRNKFLSKKVAYTYSGYAFAQLKRIRTARNWLLNPPKKKPERKDYGLPEEKLISKSELGAYQWILVDLLKESIDYLNFSDGTKEELINSNLIGLVQKKGLNSEAVDAVQKITGSSDQWMEMMQKEQSYAHAKREWDAYQSWKSGRNKKRAVLEEKFGYDCYSEDTEFLTNYGWKKFDDIEDNFKLATFNIENLNIEYQKPIEKFDGTFTGNMYNFFGNHYNCLVTPNHRMFFRKMERKSKKTFDWVLDEATTMPDCFEVLRTITANKKNYSDKNIFEELLNISPIAFMRLMGWFLSDGTFSKKNNVIKDIRISQKKDGKLHWHMSRFASQYKGFSSLYNYKRKPNNFNPNEIVEIILSVRDKKIVQKMSQCLTSDGEKRIPRWVFNLSKRLMEACLDGLILGDGTKRPDNGFIYYSKCKGLADDVQELAFSCGYETSLYGPYAQSHNGYKIEMYQVHINKNRTQTKTMVRHSNVKKVQVKNKRIVCFSVPNGTLVTRRNGHIALHGNCKHAMHLVRLMKMGKEILTTGEVHVYRPDREELLAIRNGAWTFDQVEEFANRMQEEIKMAKDQSTLPYSADLVFLDDLCAKVVEKYLSNSK